MTERERFIDRVKSGFYHNDYLIQLLVGKMSDEELHEFINSL